jgi:hypothetical protein
MIENSTDPPTTVLMKPRIGMNALDFRFCARARRRDVAAAAGEVSSSYSSNGNSVSYGSGQKGQQTNR